MNKPKCPHCGGELAKVGIIYTAKGEKKQRWQCKNCHRYSRTSVKGER